MVQSVFESVCSTYVTLILITCIIAPSASLILIDSPGHQPTLQTTAIVAADGGGWWILEQNEDQNGGTVYQYTENWGATGEVHQLTIQNRSDLSPAGISSAPKGGWWVLSDEGSVYRFTNNWSYTGESHSLRHPYYNRSLSSGSDLANNPPSGWWVVGGRDAFRVADNWSLAPATVNAIQSENRGIPSAVASDETGAIWFLMDRSVVRVPLDQSGDGVAPAYTKTVEGDFGESRLAVPSEDRSLHAVVEYPADIVQDGDRWWVVDADGDVHQFDTHWRYTGVTHKVGSGDDDYSEMEQNSVANKGPLSVPGLIGLIAGFLVFVGTVTQYRRTPVSSVVYGGILTGVATVIIIFGVLLDPYIIRPIIFTHPLLPPIIGGIGILGPITYIYILHGRFGRRLPIPLVLSCAPLLISSAIFLGEAIAV